MIATPLIPSLNAPIARNTGDERWLNVRPPHMTLTEAQTASLFAVFDASQRYRIGSRRLIKQGPAFVRAYAVNMPMPATIA